MEPTQKLRDKLCRELAQSEHDADIQCEREARRYGALPPAKVLRAIAVHARKLRPRLEPVWGSEASLGIRAGRAVGEVFSAIRHFATDWVLDAERSYRATLLGLRHGHDTARLLRSVLAAQRDREALAVCDELLEGRARLLVRVEQGLRWFAEHPDVALRSARPRAARPQRARG